MDAGGVDGLFGGGVPGECGPPAIGWNAARRLEHGAGARGGDAYAMHRGGDERALDRFRPAVQREVEGPPVQREHDVAAHLTMREHRLLGAEVNVGPERVVGTDLDHREIERAESPPDLRELVL